MINLKINRNQKFNETKLIEILFYTFPLWFIVGNGAVSINTILFIALSLFVIKKEQLSLRFSNAFWILSAFFLYLFLLTTFQFLSSEYMYARIADSTFENNPIFKSFLLIRFLILILVIDALIINKIIDIKKLFLFSLLCTSFVSFDVIFQYINGFDLFGLKNSLQWNSGPFGNEWIAGTYLANFSFFSFFYLGALLKNKKFGNLLLIFIIAFHLTATLLTGNRMPMLLFLFGCTITILFVKHLRFAMSSGLLIFITIFFIFLKSDTHIGNTYKRLLGDFKIVNLIETNKTNKVEIKKEKIESAKDESKISNEIIFLRGSGYNRIFRTSIKLWEEQPLTGFGLKSFRIKCWQILKKDDLENKNNNNYASKFACANHSHNYYFQFLSETGLIGISLIIIFFLIVLKDMYIHLKNYIRNNNAEIYLLIPIIIVIFLEIWPLRSSGNFFTNWGATFFWLNISILFSYSLKKKN